MIEIEEQSLIRHRRLPPGIRFSEVKIGSQIVTQEGKVEAHFFPGGYTDPVTIYLKDNKEREYTVFLIPFSGRVLVRQGHFEFSEIG